MNRFQQGSLSRMLSLRAWLHKPKVLFLPGFATVCLLAASIQLSKAGARESGNAQQSGSPAQPLAQVPQGGLQPQPAQVPVPAYDKAIFQNRIPADQLAFLNQFAGTPAKDLLHDKQYRKLMKVAIPNCVFHYGWDMPVSTHSTWFLGVQSCQWRSAKDDT